LPALPEFRSVIKSGKGRSSAMRKMASRRCARRNCLAIFSQRFLDDACVDGDFRSAEFIGYGGLDAWVACPESPAA
jgi:hypothetical protein